MSQTLKFGNGTWATKKGSILAYNDEGGNFKPLPFTYTGAGKGTRVNKEGLIEVVENDRPRIDYLDGEDGVFLLEKAATNYVTYSEDFTQTSFWNANSNVSISMNYKSPDGTLNASKIIPNTINSQHSIKATGQLSNNRYNYTVYVKPSGNSFFQIANQSTSDYVNFNLDNGTYFKSNSNDEVSIDYFRDGWYRCNVYFATTFQGVYNVIIDNIGSARLEGFIGNNVDGIYLWGVQAEVNSSASSYIPTQGTIQTRVQETASGSGNSEVFNSEQGVLFANIAANANDGTTRLISLSNGSDDNRLNFYYRSTANQILVKSEINNGTPTDIVVDVNNATLFSKFSIKYNSSELKVFNNGFEVGSVSGNFSYPLNSLNVLNFDNTIASGSNNFNGKTKEIAYYDEVLTDLELETLTSYRTWEEMVKELNLNIIHNE